MSFYPSKAKQRRTTELNATDPVFKPKIPIGSKVIYFHQYRDDWGHKLIRKIITEILEENPKDQPYQLKVKILIGNKAKWVSRSNVVLLEMR